MSSNDVARARGRSGGTCRTRRRRAAPSRARRLAGRCLRDIAENVVGMHDEEETPLAIRCDLWGGGGGARGGGSVTAGRVVGGAVPPPLGGGGGGGGSMTDAMPLRRPAL